ncbi:MAG TPA: hypothetical protein VGR86_14805 [Steroidobacteraceae bacterium]|nr:hypothetical protein [Steroidobacteraceae bacterium]
METQIHAEFPRRVRNEPDVKLDRVLDLRSREVDVSRDYGGIERMEAIFKRSCDTEVSATTAYCPEQVRLVMLADTPHLAVRGHQLHADQVVTSETKTP